MDYAACMVDIRKNMKQPGMWVFIHQISAFHWADGELYRNWVIQKVQGDERIKVIQKVQRDERIKVIC